MKFKDKVKQRQSKSRPESQKAHKILKKIANTTKSYHREDKMPLIYEVIEKLRPKTHTSDMNVNEIKEFIKWLEQNETNIKKLVNKQLKERKKSWQFFDKIAKKGNKFASKRKGRAKLNPQLDSKHLL